MYRSKRYKTVVGYLQFAAQQDQGRLAAMSLPHILFLLQFNLPLVGLFRLAPGFIEVDEVVPRLQCVWMSVTKFKPAAL